MTKIVIMAPRGHMDGLIVAAAHRRSDIEIVGGVLVPFLGDIESYAVRVAGLC